MAGESDNLAAELTPWKPAVNPFIIAMTVMLATFMEVLDTSIATVALPHISGNLSAGIDESTWVLTSYLVSNAIVLPLCGWFSSIFGRKQFFMTCVGVFTVSSLLCGLAPNLGWLVFFRIVQGAGGGSLQPLSQAILVESFPKSKRGLAMAIYAMGVVFAPIIGPTVGGWITDNYTWRWIFFINVPIGVLALMLTGAFIKDPPYMHRRKVRELKVDYIGLGLLSVGLGALQIMLDKGEREDWFSSNFILVLLVIAVASMVVLLVWEWWQRDPVLELHLLKDRNFAGSVVTMFLLGFVLYGSIMLLPLLMQTLMGYTAELSGMVLSPGGLVVLFTLPLVGKLLARFEARWLIIIGVLVTSYSLLMMSRFNLGIDFWTPTWARMVQGVGLAFLFVPVNSMAFHSVARDKTNYAAGLINLARNVGGSCGIAFAATMVSRWSQVHQNYLIANLSPLNPQYQAATQAATGLLVQQGQAPAVAQDQAQQMLYGATVQQASMMSFNDVFLLMAATFMLLIPVLLVMKKAPPHREGDDATPH